MFAAFNKYLTNHNQLIDTEPNNNLGIIVIIPVYNEPEIKDTLYSILKANKTKQAVEIIILINNKKTTCDIVKQQNIKTFNELKSWSSKYSNSELAFHILLSDNMPEKHAGVGMARKMAMDEAIFRFNKIDKYNGIIVSLDADTTISDNYLQKMEYEFAKNTKLNVVLPCFKHSLKNLSDTETNAIIQYELYLRYFKLALKYTGFPYAYHTIGSAFAVRALAYVKQGGMNRKQGGEDFYFLHKIFQLGQTTELYSATVFPSGRVSDRVPFGTGPAVANIIKSGYLQTYQPLLFTDLKVLFSKIHVLFNAGNKAILDIYKYLPNSLKNFMPYSEFQKKIIEINANSSSIKTFKQRFFVWFNAFKIIKYLNFSKQTYIDMPINKAVVDFLQMLKQKSFAEKSNKQLLNLLIKIEQEN